MPIQRHIKKFGCSITLGMWLQSSERVVAVFALALRRCMESGYAILQDSWLVRRYVPNPNGVPKVAVRLLGVYVGSQKVRRLPIFPLTEKDAVSCFAAISLKEAHRLWEEHCEENVFDGAVGVILGDIAFELERQFAAMVLSGL